MKQRGKKSSASLQVVEKSPISATERLEPPSSLTVEQKNVWIQVVNDMRAEWFTDSTAPLLAQYCRHVVSSERIAQMIEDLGEDDDVGEFERLLRMQERESRIIASLATKMRVSQQATYSDTKTKRSGRSKTSKKLWEQ